MKVVYCAIAVLFIQSFVSAQDGVLDPSFDEDGISIFDYEYAQDTPDDMALSGDQIFIAGGHFFSNQGNEFVLLNLNDDGAPDLSFGEEGILFSDYEGGELIYDRTMVEARPSGEVIIGAGYFDNPSSLFVFQFEGSGIPDEDFGINGIVELPVPDSVSIMIDMELKENGQLLIAMLMIEDGQNKLLFCRLDEDGSMDSTFGEAGFIISDPIPINVYNIATTFTSDHFYFAGTVDNPTVDMALCRFNLIDGSLDLDFGMDGVSEVNQYRDEAITSIAVYDDGRIRCSCFSYDEINSYADIIMIIVGFTADGELDEDFGDGGILFPDVDDPRAFASDIIIQPDNKILVSGTISIAYGDEASYAVMRFLENGDVDTTFGLGGIARIVASEDFAYCSELDLDQQGRIVVTGFADTGFSIDIVTMRFLNESISSVPGFAAEENADFIIAPNPMTDQSFQVMSNFSGTYAMEIRDITGRLVHIENNFVLAPQGSVQIVIHEELLPGEYFVVMKGKEHCLSRRFCKL